MSKRRKKKEKPQLDIRGSIIAYLRERDSKKAISENQITKRFNRRFPRGEIIRTLYAMAAEGVLFIMSGNKFKLKPAYLIQEVKARRTGEEWIGVVDMTKSHDAYIVVEGVEDDIHVSRKNLNQALHKDTVKVSALRSGRRKEGIVTEVIERHRTTFIGTVDKKKHCFIRPNDISMYVDFFIPEEKSDELKHGQKVVVEMIDWPKGAKSPFGEVIEVLGDSGDNDVEMKSLLIEHGFYLKFSPETMREANALTTKIPAKEYEKRRDFRDVLTMTIDPFGAKDFDDALSIRKLDSGNWEVGIHIADVSHYVRPGMAMDEDAYKRATSVYLVDRVAPMLPEQLSNVICSLRPNEDKCSFSAVFELNEQAKVINQWFGKTIIRSDKRFAYEQVQEILDKGEGLYHEELAQLNKLSQKLRDKRFQEGSVNFDSQEVRFTLDENGKPIGVRAIERQESHMLIEDFMLLANRRVALFIGKEMNASGKVPFVYRVHDEPDMEKLMDFSRFARRFGYKINIDNPKKIAQELNKLIVESEGQPEAPVLQQLAIRCMAKAVYTTDNIGHYGLGFEYYTHFTSPIRRYPDIIVHRTLHRILEEKPLFKKRDLEIMSTHCSQQERAAMDAERESVKYKMIEYMEDRIGEVFEGVISGIKTWGVYVELPGYNTEGMVRIDSFDDDNYVVDEKKMMLRGTSSDQKYYVGDTIYVEVAKVDKFRKTIDFDLSSKEEFLESQEQA